MKDKYKTFAGLSRSEKPNKDYRVRLRNHPGTIAIVAPHGGAMQPGTSEIAHAIAKKDLSFYAFEGMKRQGNQDLHITSTRFDEPQCIDLIATSEQVVTVHGENSNKRLVYLGGRDRDLISQLYKSLESSGFRVKRHHSPFLQGLDRSNLCNRGRMKSGVQVEISRGLRRSFFHSLSGMGRQTKTSRFHEFVAALRTTLLADRRR